MTCRMFWTCLAGSVLVAMAARMARVVRVV